MYWRVEVKDKEGVFNSLSESLRGEISEAGFGRVEGVQVSSVFFLIGSLSKEEAGKIASDLLADAVTQQYSLYREDESQVTPAGFHALQILYKPGVMDPTEDSVLKGARDLGITSLSAVRTAKRYLFKGNLSKSKLLALAEKFLYNKLIQFVLPEETHALGDFSNLPDYKFHLTTVDLLAASDSALKRLSLEGQLYLNLSEMKAVQAYFKKLKRNPTDVELETIAQTWSEHCVHKTFRGLIDYKEKLSGKKGHVRFVKRLGNIRINSLLKSTIMKATGELKKSYCVSVFKDNSGIIKFDDKYDVCFKVETHNHPSALEPYGGANTGIGGVIRDPMGTGLGSKPILNTDVFCFGPLDLPSDKVPAGALHPRRVAKGVVSGVRDYGNRMGIPTANGAVLFDERFIGNPLVYCGTVGIMPVDKAVKRVKTGDLIVVVGGRTGRDGIHGATFSSGELTHESETESSGAVQIGNAITEKKMLDVLLKCRDKNFYDAITDCGAGGLSSAVGEMGQDLGARVHLERVPLKYHGLNYTEIWISESQERMVLSVRKEKAQELLDAFAKEDVEATVIGEFTNTKKLELFYADDQVCSLDMDFLHEGLPKITKKALWTEPKAKPNIKIASKKDQTQNLLKLLSAPDTASKEWVIRQYDHEVQGATVVKPLVGVASDGPSDAAVIKPRFDSMRGLVVSCGINFNYGDLDPYWMAAGNVDEALRQIISVGGSLKNAAILDNFCWGNPDKPDRLGGLVRAAFGCYDASKGFGVPFISGKDSLYNEFTIKNKSISIPGTLLISAIAVVDDVSRSVTMDLKGANNLLYIVGETFQELGGSQYLKLLKKQAGTVPQVDFKKARRSMESLSSAAEKGLVRSIHDCSEGGMAVALAEMTFAGGLGASVFLSDVPYRGVHKRNDFILFSESHSRFIVEVQKDKQKAFEKAMKNTAIGLIGCVTDSKQLTIFGLDGKICVEAGIMDLKGAWQETLRTF